MTEPKKDELLRAPEVADLDPYNTRGKPKQEEARELIGEEVEVQEDENFDGPRFTEEQREKLRDIGYVIFHIKKESIKTLNEKGWDITLGSNFAGNSADVIEDDSSIPTEVAVMYHPFLDGSFSKSFGEQVEMIRKFDEEIRSNVPGVKARIGEASDYAMIYLGYRALFGKHLARTASEADYLVCIGEKSIGRLVLRNDIDHKPQMSVGIIPLIVPQDYPGNAS